MCNTGEGMSGITSSSLDAIYLLWPDSTLRSQHLTLRPGAAMTQLVCTQSLTGLHPAARVSLWHAVLSFLL